MNITNMNLQDLESCFNLVCKVRDSIIMMARANHNLNTPEVKNINSKYDLLYNEIMIRINNLYTDNNIKKETLNEEVAH